MRNKVESFDQQSLPEKSDIIAALFAERANEKVERQKHVAIVMATYNRFSYLLTYLYSLFLQDNVQVKFYISDDCSTDQTREYFTKLSQQYPELLYYHYSLESIGPSSNRKIALKAVDADFIVLADDDDYYINPNFLSHSIESIEQSCGDISICFGSAIVLDTATKYENTIMLDYLGSSSQDVFSNLLFSMKKPPSTFLMLFRLTPELQQQLLEMKMLNDVSIYLLVLDYFKGTVGGSSQVSGIYREHATNITKRLDFNFMLENFLQKIEIVKSSSLSQKAKRELIYKHNKMNIEYYFANSVTTKEERAQLYQTLKDQGFGLSFWEKWKYRRCYHH